MPVQNLDFTGGRIARAKYQYSLQSGDIDALYAKAPEMEQAMTQLPACATSTATCRSTTRSGGSTSTATSGGFGITADAVRTALYDAFGTRQISTIFTEADDYEVILEASDKFQRIRRARPHSGLDADASSCRSTRLRRCGARLDRCRSTASRSSPR